MTNIFVAKLDYGVTQENLKSEFEKFGKVNKLFIYLNKLLINFVTLIIILKLKSCKSEEQPIQANLEKINNKVEIVK